MYSLSFILRFWLPLWHLQNVFIVLSALRFTTSNSDYPFRIFKLLTIVLSVLGFTTYDDPFRIFKPFVHCIVCPWIYDLWLPLWHLPIFGHCIVSFDLRLLIIPLVSSNLAIALSVLRFTASNYPFDIFKSLAIALSVLDACQRSGTIYCDWLYC